MLPNPLILKVGSKVKNFNFIMIKAVVIFFTEILHAGRGVIDMKHIKWDFSLKPWVQFHGVDLGVGPSPKLKFFLSEYGHVAYQMKLAETW